MLNVPITPPRVPVIDPRTGNVSREWYQFFLSLYTITGSATGVTPVASGGTGLSTIPTNGQLLIGNGSGYTLRTLTAGTGVTITNTAGAISISITADSIVTKTSDYTATATDYTILCDAAAGAIAITLPDAATLPAYVYTIKKIDTSANQVVITPTGTDTVDGSATAAILVPFVSITVQSDGTNWYIL